MSQRRTILAGALAVLLLGAVAAGAVWAGVARIATDFQPPSPAQRLDPLDTPTHPFFRMPPTALIPLSAGSLLLTAFLALLFLRQKRPTLLAILASALLIAVAVGLALWALNTGRPALEQAPNPNRSASRTFTWLLILVPVLLGVLGGVAMLLRRKLTGLRLTLAASLLAILLASLLCTPLVSRSGASGGGAASAAGKGTLLENGLTVGLKGKSAGQPNISPQGAHQLSDIPVFLVSGANGVARLRTTVGDVYNGFEWRLGSGEAFQKYNGETLSFPEVSSSGQDAALTVKPLPEGVLAPGLIAQSLYPKAVRFPSPLAYNPQALLFRTEKPLSTSYSWDSQFITPSQAALKSATTSPSAQELQLPANISEQVQRLAHEITDQYDAPYDKAKALEVYLKKTYPYDLNYREAPSGWEPTDWFLFKGQSGVCANFASAFTIMARVVGLPARMVAGWAVSPTAEQQTVRAYQAHAWPEVRFDELGWVTFEPTASGGPPSRINPQTPPSAQSNATPLPSGQSGVTGSPKPKTPTVTEITSAGGSARKGYPYTIRGTVLVQGTGAPVDGLQVQAYLNPQKNLIGATLLGQGTVHNGVFALDTAIPKDLEVGPIYQLFAVTTGNDQFAGSQSDPPVVVFTGSDLSLEGPAQANVDESVPFSGKLLEEFGEPVSNQPITLSITPANVLRTVSTTFEGAYDASHVFRDPGDYTVHITFAGTPLYLPAEAAKTLRIMMPTALELQAASEQEVLQPYTLRLALADRRGKPLGSLPIQASIGASQVTLTTALDGSASFTRIFDLPGEYPVTVQFPGQGYFLPSRQSFTLRVYTVTIDTHTDASWVRGEEVPVNGRLSLKGQRLPRERLTLKLDGSPLGELLTDAQGDFAVHYPVPAAAALGSHTLSYEVPRFSESKPQSITIQAATRLALSGKFQGRAGQKTAFRASLSDNLDAPVPNSSLIASGPGNSTTPATTNPLGLAAIQLSLPKDLEPGNYDLHVQFPGSPLYLPSSATVPVEVLSPAKWWLYVTLLLAVSVLACAIMLWLRQRRRRAAQLERTAFPQDESLAATVEQRKPVTVNILFPQIAPPFPAVWGVGDPLTVEAAVSESGESTPVQGQLVLHVVEREQALQTNEAGKASFQVRYLTKGQATLAVVFPGDDRHLPGTATQTVRIVDYREEVVALFKEFLGWARAKGVRAHDEATPRELEANVLAAVPDIEAPALGTVVSGFEEAEYSLHPMRRRQYEQMFLAVHAFLRQPLEVA